MAEPARKLTTVDEFLRWDSGDDRRYQLIRGAIVMMAPPAPLHGALAARMARSIGNRLKAPCEVISEAGIFLPKDAHDFYVADLAVTCSGIADEPWCPEPIVIIEVLSPSTADEVRLEKLPNYRQLPSLRDILLVAADAVSIEHWRRPALAWSREVVRAGGTLRLAGLAIEIPVDEVYGGLGL